MSVTVSTTSVCKFSFWQRLAILFGCEIRVKASYTNTAPVLEVDVVMKPSPLLQESEQHVDTSSVGWSRHKCDDGEETPIW